MKRLTVLAPLVFATSLTFALGGPAEAQHVRSPTAAPTTPGASTVLAAIEGSLADSATLQDELSALLAKLEALADERPTRPDRRASKEETTAWERATLEWQARVDRLQARIDALQAKRHRPPHARHGLHRAVTA